MSEVYNYIKQHIDDLDKDDEYTKEYIEGQINLAFRFNIISIDKAMELNRMLQ